MKVLVIGIDGMSWAVLNRLLPTGKLPNLSSFVAEGAHGRMQNLGETESPIIWTTIATGKLPEQHRIFGFTGYFGRHWPVRGRELPWFTGLPRTARRALLRTGMVYRGSVRSFMRKCKALWNMVSDAGRTVGMASWWASHPPEPVSGFNVSDLANFALLTIRSRQGLAKKDEEARMGLDTLVHPPQDGELVASWYRMEDEEFPR